MICPHCKTNNLIKEDGKRKCLSCGREVLSHDEKHKFFLRNEKEIVQDYTKMELSKLCKKWGLSTTSLYKLDGIREIVDQRHSLPQNNHNRLPKMPEFSNEWTSDVQLKWLEIYSVLLEKEKTI